jgi:hypothetical protein
MSGPILQISKATVYELGNQFTSELKLRGYNVDEYYERVMSLFKQREQ